MTTDTERAQVAEGTAGVTPSDGIAQIKGDVAELSAAIQTGDGAKVTELGAAYFGEGGNDGR